MQLPVCDIYCREGVGVAGSAEERGNVNGYCEIIIIVYHNFPKRKECYSQYKFRFRNKIQIYEL
jgi:hypothetical protein